MKKNILKRLERLFVAREKYKKLERDIYKVFTEEDCGNYELFDGTKAYIGIMRDYNYSKEFLDKMKLLYDEEKKNSTKKDIIYVRYHKKEIEDVLV